MIQESSDNPPSIEASKRPVYVTYLCKDPDVSRLVRTSALFEDLNTHATKIDSINELFLDEDSLPHLLIVDVTDEQHERNLLESEVRSALSGCEILVLCSEQDVEVWQHRVLRGEVDDYFVAWPLYDPQHLKVQIWRAIERSSSVRRRGLEETSESNSETESANVIKAQEEPRQYEFSGKRILVIEDEKDSAQVVYEILVAEGFEVKHATSVKDAYVKFADESFDVVLADLMMPGISGSAVVKTIKAKLEWSEVPILVTTAHSSHSLVRECLREGAKDYLVKPITRETLMPRIASILGLTWNNPQPADDETRLS